MELSFTAGIVILVLVYIFRNPIKRKAEDIEKAMKVQSAKSGVETARELIDIEKDVVALGKIPNVDVLLDVLDGKKAQNQASTSSTDT